MASSGSGPGFRDASRLLRSKTRKRLAAFPARPGDRLDAAEIHHIGGVRGPVRGQDIRRRRRCCWQFRRQTGQHPAGQQGQTDHFAPPDHDSPCRPPPRILVQPARLDVQSSLNQELHQHDPTERGCTRGTARLSGALVGLHRAPDVAQRPRQRKYTTPHRRNRSGFVALGRYSVRI